MAGQAEGRAGPWRQDEQGAPAGGYALGVDLGTSNTVAVLRWPDGRTRPLLFDGQPIMPSGVFLDPAGGLHVGRDAQRLAQSEPARYEPNPKRRIDEPGVLLGDREVSTVDLLAAVLAAVARTAVEAVGFLPPAVLTYPAAWGGRRREVLAAAVARAGWPPVDPSTIHTGATPATGIAPFAGGPRGPGGAGRPGTVMVPEPIAAARYFADVLRRPVPTGASIAVFDLGGGTLDIAVIRNEGPDAVGRARFAVLGSGGVAELGGLDLDAALVEHLGDLVTASAPQAWRQLSAPQGPAQARDRRQFWDDVRGAKEMLSRTASAPVAVPGVDQALHLTREELERLATPLLRQGVYETARVIADCQLERHQLAGLFLVGGSSRVPLVARMLHAELGIAPTVLEQPELPVAEGALAELAPPPSSAALTNRGGAQVGAPPPVSAPPVSAPPVGTPPLGSAQHAGAPPIGGPPLARAPHAGAAPVSGPPVSPPPTGAGQAPTSGVPVSPVSAYPMTSGTGRDLLRRRAVIWLAAAAVVAVLAASGAIAWYLTRGPSDLDFQDVAEVVKIPTSDERPYYAFTHTVGDRMYLAWQRKEQLEVIAVDAGSGRERWRKTMPGTSAQWAGITAYEHVVVVAAENSSSSEPRAMYVVDPDNGEPLWRRDIFGDDRFIVYDDIGVLVDDKEKRLVGLDIRTGKSKWTQENPKDQYDRADASVFVATTEADLEGAADADGVPFAPVIDDDYRLVQISSDRKARVIDARNGKVLAERGNVGDPTGKYLAYEGRLLAVGTGEGYRIDAYDLDKLGEPRGVYRAPDRERVLERLAPCGAERVCVLDSRSADAATREVAAIDAGKGGQVWRQPAPQADLLVPVGEGVLVQRTSGTPSWALRDADGGEVLRRDGTAVRLDAGNVLSFVGTLSTSPTDLSVAGVGADAGKATELGPLQQARGDTCSWNARVITCLTDTTFVLWRFAAE